MYPSSGSRHVEGPVAAFWARLVADPSQPLGSGIEVDHFTSELLRLRVAPEQWVEAQQKLVDLAAETRVELSLPD